MPASGADGADLSPWTASATRDHRRARRDGRPHRLPHVPPIDLSTTNPLPTVESGGDAYEHLALGGSLEPGVSGLPAPVGLGVAGSSRRSRSWSGPRTRWRSRRWSLLSACLIARPARPAARRRARPLYGGSDHVLATGLSDHGDLVRGPGRGRGRRTPRHRARRGGDAGEPSCDLVDLEAVVAWPASRCSSTTPSPPCPASSRPGTGECWCCTARPSSWAATATWWEAWCPRRGLGRLLRQVRALTGGILHLFAAYLLHRGLRTLPLRVRAAGDGGRAGPAPRRARGGLRRSTLMPGATRAACSDGSRPAAGRSSPWSWPAGTPPRRGSWSRASWPPTRSRSAGWTRCSTGVADPPAGGARGAAGRRAGAGVGRARARRRPHRRPAPGARRRAHAVDRFRATRSPSARARRAQAAPAPARPQDGVTTRSPAVRGSSPSMSSTRSTRSVTASSVGGCHRVGRGPRRASRRAPSPARRPGRRTRHPERVEVHRHALRAGAEQQVDRRAAAQQCATGWPRPPGPPRTPTPVPAMPPAGAPCGAGAARRGRDAAGQHGRQPGSSTWTRSAPGTWRRRSATWSRSPSASAWASFAAGAVVGEDTVPLRPSTVAASVHGPATCALSRPANPCACSSSRSRSCARRERARRWSTPGASVSRQPAGWRSAPSSATTASARPVIEAGAPRPGSSGRNGVRGLAEREAQGLGVRRRVLAGHRPDAGGHDVMRRPAAGARPR